jgi:hypothetical protein
MGVMQSHFTALFYRDGDSWVGCVEEFPGTRVQAATLDEARLTLKEQVNDILSRNREKAAGELSGRSVLKEQLIVTS